MWNIALGRIATAIWIRSFLTLGSVNQNDQLILDHFALVSRSDHCHVVRLVRAARDYSRRVTGAVVLTRVRGANPRAALVLTCDARPVLVLTVRRK